MAYPRCYDPHHSNTGFRGSPATGDRVQSARFEGRPPIKCYRTLWIILILLLASPLTAQVVNTITFDTQPDVDCGDIWVEDGVDCMVTFTTDEDACGAGSCWFDFGDPLNTGVFLAPARLVVLFDQAYRIYRVEIDVTDYCGIGCTMCFAYEGAATVGTDTNDFVSQEEVMVMDWGVDGVMVDRLAVSSCEGHVSGNSIRIYSEVVANEDGTWGDVKTLYR